MKVVLLFLAALCTHANIALAAESGMRLVLKPGSHGHCFDTKDWDAFKRILEFWSSGQGKARVTIQSAVSAKCQGEIESEFRSHSIEFLSEKGKQGPSVVVETKWSSKPKTASPTIAATAGVATTSASSTNSTGGGESSKPTSTVNVASAAGPATATVEPSLPGVPSPNSEQANGAPDSKSIAGLTSAPNSNVMLEAPSAADNSVDTQELRNKLLQANKIEKDEPHVPWDVSLTPVQLTASGSGLAPRTTGFFPANLSARRPIGETSAVAFEALLPVAFGKSDIKPTLVHGLYLMKWAGISSRRCLIETGLGFMFLQQSSDTSSQSKAQGDQLFDQTMTGEGRLRSTCDFQAVGVRGDLALMPTFNEEFKPGIGLLYGLTISRSMLGIKWLFSIRSESFKISGTANSTAADLYLSELALGAEFQL